jgi:hypothetical protein
MTSPLGAARAARRIRAEDRRATWTMAAILASAMRRRCLTPGAGKAECATGSGTARVPVQGDEEVKLASDPCGAVAVDAQPNGARRVLGLARRRECVERAISQLTPVLGSSGHNCCGRGSAAARTQSLAGGTRRFSRGARALGVTSWACAHGCCVGHC